VRRAKFSVARSQPRRRHADRIAVEIERIVVEEKTFAQERERIVAIEGDGVVALVHEQNLWFSSHGGGTVSFDALELSLCPAKSDC
jgi:hypothetical protein